jgi:quercetin dioxygenase-like cupin family protein
MSARTFDLSGNQATIRASTEDTAGTFSMLEFVAPPGATELPAHLHTREDECLFVLEGRLMVNVGGEERLVEAGGFVFMPRRDMHSWRNPEAEPARFLIMLLPGGGERYFLDLAAVLATGVPPNIHDLAPLMAHHGMRPVQALVHVLPDQAPTVS